ncbi:hypothetical protein CKO16_15175 [Rhodoblastus acidophilus]|nr:hypothetical protein CKO16_15175 [Rhodoblastus acidophilus]
MDGRQDAARFVEQQLLVVGDGRLAPGFATVIARFENGARPAKSGVFKLFVARRDRWNAGAIVVGFGVQHLRISFYL